MNEARPYQPPPGRPRSIPPMSNGASPETPPLRAFQLDEEAIIAAYKGGMLGRHVCTEFNCSPSQLYRLLKKRNVAKNYPDMASIAARRRQPQTATAVDDDAYPTRRPDEKRQQLTARIVAWKRAHDPEYDKAVHANLRRGQLRRASRRRRLESTEIQVPHVPLFRRIGRWFMRRLVPKVPSQNG